MLNKEKYDALEKYYGYTEFREGQEALIDATLTDRDCLGIMPTGSGKSLCYQIPSMILSGVTIVISPLISLMEEQVVGLNDDGIPAAYINSSLSTEEYNFVCQNAVNNKYKIIYVAPERLSAQSFLDVADKLDISFLAVDEAHCISQWGQNFRPSYLHIVEFINQLEKRPVIGAYTATATKGVKEDIVAILGLNNPEIVSTGFNRKNLYLEVRKPSNKMNELMEFLKGKESLNGIIYCNTRKNVEEVHDTLVEAGYSATRYHAGLSFDERKTNQEDFIYDRKQIVVATNAFGMGIDKSNVRYVVHYNMPKDIESYYQEIGRAGRDGEPADCVLLYSAKDVHVNEYLINQREDNEEFDQFEEEQIRERERIRLKQMTYYCFTPKCLREYILAYFGEVSEPFCGNCSNCNQEFEEVDITSYTISIINLIGTSGQKYGRGVISEAIHGSSTMKTRKYNLDENPFFGKLKSITVQNIRQIMNFLLVENYIVATDDQYPVIKIGKNGMEFVSACKSNEGWRVIMKKPKDSQEDATKVKSKKKNVVITSNPDLFQLLREERYKIAQEIHKPPYIIFNDRTLTEMSEKMPITREAMMEITGVGENKMAHYGQRFINVIVNYKV